MNCPRDGTEMQYQGFWKHPRHVCPACKGLFATEKDLTESSGHKRARSFAEAAGAKLDNLAESGLACPADGTTLRVARYQGAEVDVCPACKAIWLDPGELEKIGERAQQAIEARRPAPKPRREVEAERLGPPPGGDPDASIDGVLRGVRAFFRGMRLARRVLK